MSGLVRKVVSKNKRRLREDGFDLDLSYITPRLIAMGFPSESMEGVYRNPFKEVFRFLELKHKDRYKVYNLCSERGYDISKSNNRVECFPFDDHNAPPLTLVQDFCINVKEWLSVHPENIAVVHCKAGKGRTGLMICSYLLHSGEWKTAQQAMEFYAAMRTHNKKGVTIPSQIRYVHYFASVVQNSYQLPEPKPLLLKSIQFHTIPKVPHVTDIRFSVYVMKTLVYTFKDSPKVRSNKRAKKARSSVKSAVVNMPITQNESFVEDDTKDEEESLIFECPPIPVCGDIKMEFYENQTFGSDQKLFAFWFNTAFATEDLIPRSYSLEISKEALDKAHKDKQCKIFKENFRVICSFQALESDRTPSKELSELAIEETKDLSPSIDNYEKGPQSATLIPLIDKYPSLKNL